VQTRIFRRVFGAIVLGSSIVSVSSWAGLWVGGDVTATWAPARYRLARNPGSALLNDGANQVSLICWEGLDQSNPADASHVFFTHWNPTSEWSTPTMVDQGIVGGRHPLMARNAAGDLLVTWHDGRHATPGGNYIDNLEIYGRRRVAGAWNATDERLTQSEPPAHLGDNGYMPTPMVLGDDRWALAWYDFNADGNVSDLYLREADALGIFAIGESFANWRLTDLGDRGNATAFTVPDAAADSTGDVHLTWTTDFGSTGAVWYARYNAATDTIDAPVQIATQAAGYLDPPRIVVASDDDVVIIWADKRAGFNEDIYLRRRAAGAPAFGTEIRITSATGREHSPTAVADADGTLVMSWVAQAGALREVHVSRLQPDSGTVVTSERVDDAVGAPPTGLWARPCVALNDAGEAFVVWEQEIDTTSARLWYATDWAAALSGAESWIGYE